jgi:hypothetical protein
MTRTNIVWQSRAKESIENYELGPTRTRYQHNVNICSGFPVIYIRSLLANKKNTFFVFLMSLYIFLTTCFSGSRLKFLILTRGGGGGFNEL